MFIERFFNPEHNSNRHGNYADLKKALEHCKNGRFIRHYSFPGNCYIEYKNNKYCWNDGSRVDLRKLPKKQYGKFVSNLYNYQLF